ncbi:MAG TPA: aminotransferase class V-fold PLP-dependent enzyme [Ignavibacteriaceae bacterium]|jgi:glutamate/tyrosine decarboxylase-like PLP-dependent enzyme|nr:MAG: L-2,4-diaminobutyrate decarboxylase [Ignavibacteria bacterium ADurb.Bin266]OQY73866.1 MAG: L-2,4-diaminobutyrate decarboxylase [Ignavibacteriales bacterium UTCHB2]HQF41626.1 aminotransferase class V-fold PLP-dependent enzyme [Ignavibacteriaceae bacterium]HQI41012.1 aminotransferase class V-fold PLP-dependent enzyme [Ignavibacteriaceae bacterium]
MNSEEIIKQLNELSFISNELEVAESDRLRMIKTVSDYANKFLSGLDDLKVFSERKPGSLVIKNKKRSLEELLNVYQAEVAETGINAASGKHLGYIPSGGIFTAALADFIAAVTNPYASVYYASPGAADIEKEVINWLKKVFSFPESSVGNLTSVGSVSALIAFTAARDKHKIKNELIQKSVVYLTEQVHHSVQKVLRIIGLEDIIIRYVELDENHRLKTNSLIKTIEKDISSGLNPFLVVGTAGTTDTGAVDPLNEISEIAKQYKMWFHVDAAYGGFFILTSKKDLFKGIENADSLIIDPHKGMFIPYGVGAVLIKDKNSVLHSNYYTANYMQDAVTEEMIKSPANLSPELTKHFRGLRVWLPLQIHGVEPFVACLEEKLLLVKYFRNKLSELGFKVGPEPDLSVSYFWYPFKFDSNEKNKQLMKEIHADGDVFLSSSVINGQFVIRIAILVFRTKKETIDKAVKMIERCLEKVMSR